MKIKTTKENILLGIQIVQNIVNPKSTLPILSNLLIETKKDTIKLNATDLDIGISCEVPVSILEEGAITIPAKKFSDIIRELPPGDITIVTKKNNQIEIEGDKIRFKLSGLPKEEFPKFPEFNDTEVVQIEQNVLKEMLRLTSFAVSHEESRYVLNGVLLEIDSKVIRIVATDGRRLAKIEKKLPNPTKKEISVIIPIKAIHEINRNLKEEGMLSFVASANQALFDIGGILIATRIIEGEFPNYSQVIPEPVAAKIKINTQDLLSAIRRANLLTTPDFQAIKFEVFKEKLIVSKTTPDVGESREEVAIEYGGPELIVGFNPQFLIDVLKNVNAEHVEWELSGSDKPGVMRLEDYLYLALPMRLQNV
ncbi:MAG TPA: DNA polymerase III subunit beta [Candidatus Omnitrophota bacterium]|nr:DNA polymerase III subunit beta [Candidatus Omnitrophota bacterium]HPD84593.1 DNA polymerase III subunit beta [Candidatus Omnitrophota bacterium]HRZ03451.1 DNA polymerase III subunit beta [Candidatus Omnitrophota bacterium]